MLWSAFLVAAAAMLVCYGPLASGRFFTREECGKIMWDDWFNVEKYHVLGLTTEDREFLDGCVHKLHSVLHGLIPRDDVPGTRQECRTLSDDSRRRLFGCFNRAANSGRMAPFEAMHRLTIARNAHFGTCFASWHRVFLAIIEIALRTICGDPAITLCYWDVTLDSQLPNPCESAIFTETYFGNENGPVRTGPYANKQCLGDCRIRGSTMLSRQCGSAALSTEGEIMSILTARSYAAMTRPGNIGPLEAIHGENHMFIGGHMALITCSPCDCIFFALHSYVDLIVDMNLRSRGADIDQEYPQDRNIPQFHRANDLIQPFNNVTCVEALRPRPDSTPYAPPVVQCNDHDDCGGRALWCNRGRCAGCVRGGARMVRGWPDRACYIEGCANTVNANGACGCGGPGPNDVQ